MRFLGDATGPIPNDWFENDPVPHTDLRAPLDAQSKELAAFVEKRELTLFALGRVAASERRKKRSHNR